MRSEELKPINRTGTARASKLAEELVAAARRTEPPPGDAGVIAQVRTRYAEQAEPPGAMPAPVPDAPRMASRAPSLVLADKLGERLAFERTGVRLYDALISKHDAFGAWWGGPSRRDLVSIRSDELEHFHMLWGVIVELGADPTAVTPSANLQGVMSSGLCQALTDPRTDLQEGLEAILVAELVDNDCWENLTDLAAAIGRTDLAERFMQAILDERDHLRRVRGWLGAALHTMVPGVAPEPFDVRASLREALLGEMLYAEERGPRGWTSQH